MNQNLNGQCIVFCRQMAMTILMIMMILITLFLLSKTKLFVPDVTFSTRGNQLLGKGCERSVYWNEYKTKGENKNMTK